MYTTFDTNTCDPDQQHETAPIVSFSLQQTLQRSSASTIMASAYSKVFRIPELVGQILVNLDMQELFVLQRINKIVRNTIASSKHCRQKMYLETFTGDDQV